MSFRQRIITFAAPAALLLAAGCATPFRANVSRFQMMPPPQGQTFTVQSADPRMQGGIEFGMYAQLVASQLAQRGYRAVGPGQPATFVVLIDYGIDNGHEKVVTEPGFGPWGGYGGFGGWGYDGFGYAGRFGWGGGFGRGGWGGGWGGWGGWGPGWGYPDVESFTYFVSHLDMRIRRTADGQVLFEGRARARSTDHSLQHLVPNLVDAMFTGFPGRSGEDVIITLPPPNKAGSPPPPPRPGADRPPPLNS